MTPKALQRTVGAGFISIGVYLMGTGSYFLFKNCDNKVALPFIIVGAYLTGIGSYHMSLKPEGQECCGIQPNTSPSSVRAIQLAERTIERIP